MSRGTTGLSRVTVEGFQSQSLGLFCIEIARYQPASQPVHLTDSEAWLAQYWVAAVKSTQDGLHEIGQLNSIQHNMFGSREVG